MNVRCSTVGYSHRPCGWPLETAPELKNCVFRRSKLAATDKRMGWDSNPRATFAAAGFQDRCIQPLCHPSFDQPIRQGFASGTPANAHATPARPASTAHPPRHGPAFDAATSVNPSAGTAHRRSSTVCRPTNARRTQSARTQSIPPRNPQSSNPPSPPPGPRERPPPVAGSLRPKPAAEAGRGPRPKDVAFDDCRDFP